MLVANAVYTNNMIDYSQTTHRQTGNAVLLSMLHKLASTEEPCPGTALGSPVHSAARLCAVWLPVSAHDLLGTAPRSRLASCSFSTKPQAFADRWFCKRESLHVGMYIFSSCFSKLEKPSPVTVNQAIIKLNILRELLLHYQQSTSCASSEQLVTVIHARILCL